MKDLPPTPGASSPSASPRGAAEEAPRDVQATDKRLDPGSPDFEPLLLKDREAARACSISTAHLWRLLAAGRFPRGLLLGRCRRWSAASLRSWIAAGCPPVNSEGLHGGSSKRDKHA